MKRPGWRLTVAVAMAVVAAAAASASGATTALSTVPGSGVQIEVEGWVGLAGYAEDGRDCGLMPLTITIVNGSDAAREWVLASDHRFGRAAAAMPRVRIAVPAGREGKATVYVEPGDRWGVNQAWLAISGFGVSGGTQHFNVGGGGVAATPGGPPPLPAGLSQRTLAAQGNTLKAFAISGQGLDMGRGPEDWRGWSIFSSLLLTEDEMLAMPAGTRAALLEWVALGGRAGVLVAAPSAERLRSLGFPAADVDKRHRLGAGEVVPLPWDGTTMHKEGVEQFLAVRDFPWMAGRIRGYTGDSDAGPFDQPTTRWQGGFKKLFDVFGPRGLPMIPIIGFLAIFGLLAGPFNVMLFAGPGRRPRMFWTTPAISLAATVFLMGLMLLRDGVGGTGARRVLALLMPDQNGMAIIQEQFSRTGVILDGSFPIREPSWMRPLGAVEMDDGFDEEDGVVRRGDWFRSRSDQAYLLETVRPSRAKIEVAAPADGSPVLISSIEVPLDRVWVIDEEGRYWTAADVGTGERKPLGRGDAAAYARWFESIEADAGPVRRAALEAVRNRRGLAYAQSRQAAEVAIETHGAIRWRDDAAAFIGPFTRVAQP